MPDDKAGMCSGSDTVLIFGLTDGSEWSEDEAKPLGCKCRDPLSLGDITRTEEIYRQMAGVGDSLRSEEP